MPARKRKQQLSMPYMPLMPDRVSHRTATDDDRTAWKEYLLTQKGLSLERPALMMFYEADIWTLSRVLRNPHLAHTLMEIPSIREAARKRTIQVLGGWAGSMRFGLELMERCRLEADIVQDPQACKAALKGIHNAVKRQLFLIKKKERSAEDQKEVESLTIDIKRASLIFIEKPLIPR